MLAYIVLGSGVVLVLGSVLYTRSVDNRITRQLEEIEYNRGKYDPFTESEQDLKQVSQVKGQVSKIGKELEQLIQDLKDQEAEVKDLVQSVKSWNQELSTPKFTEILDQVAALKEEPINRDDEVEQLHNAHQSLLASNTTQVQPTTLTKHDQIVNLLEQGRSIEEIARTLNMGFREVELVVKLKGKGAKSGA